MFRIAAVAKSYRFESPLSFKLVGININQDDMPWWCIAVLNWIAMVQALYEGFGENGISYQGHIDRILSKGRPIEVYKLYETYSEALRAEKYRKAAQ